MKIKNLLKDYKMRNQIMVLKCGENKINVNNIEIIYNKNIEKREVHKTNISITQN